MRAPMPKPKKPQILHPAAQNNSKSGTGGLYAPTPKPPTSGLKPLPAPPKKVAPVNNVAPNTLAPSSTLPATQWKIGQNMGDGYVFAGYVMRDGKYVPTVKTKNGTAIHPKFQNKSGGIGIVPPGTKAPTSVKPTSQTGTPVAPVTPAPVTPVTPSPVLPNAPSWIQNLFPNGLTTNPSNGVGGSWNLNWDNALNEWKQASIVDPEYAGDYSAALFGAMQDLAPLQSEVQSLLSVDPATGRTRYQQELLQAQKNRDRNVSGTYSNAAARGVSRSGMMNNNLTGIADSYIPLVNQLNNQYGDSRLSQISSNVSNRLQGLNMALVDAYQRALARAYSNVAQLGVE